MYNIKYGKHMFGFNFIFGISFFMAGAIILAVFIFITFSENNTKENLTGETYAINFDVNCHKDSDGDTLCSPTYYYEVEGNTYTCGTNFSTNSKNFGKYTKIYYGISNPSTCVSEYEEHERKMFTYFMALPLVFMIIGACFVVSAIRSGLKLKKLNTTGTLYKNLPYKMVNSNTSVNGRNLLCIQVDFTSPTTGATKVLTGKPRMDTKTADADGMVDLLIDLNDESNYYLDFNINPKI